MNQIEWSLKFLAKCANERTLKVGQYLTCDNKSASVLHCSVESRFTAAGDGREIYITQDRAGILLLGTVHCKHGSRMDKIRFAFAGHTAWNEA